MVSPNAATPSATAPLCTISGMVCAGFGGAGPVLAVRTAERGSIRTRRHFGVLPRVAGDAAMKRRTKPLPPFGRELLEARRRITPISLHVCLTWSRAKRRAPPHVLLLPPGDEPAQFNWHCAAGLDVTRQGVGYDEERLERLAYELLAAVAHLVVVLFARPEEPNVVRCGFFHAEEFRRAIA